MCTATLVRITGKLHLARDRERARRDRNGETSTSWIAERRSSDTRLGAREFRKPSREKLTGNRVVCSDWFGVPHDRQVLVRSVLLSRSGFVLFRLGREVRSKLDGVHPRNRRSRNWPQIRVLHVLRRPACDRRESRALHQSVWFLHSGTAQPRLACDRERGQRDRKERPSTSVITERRSSGTRLGA